MSSTSLRKDAAEAHQLQLGRDLVARWVGVFKALTLYAWHHSAVRSAATRVLEVARELVRRCIGAQDLSASLAFDEVESRLASLLLLLAEEHGKYQEDGSTVIDLRLTHQELASMIVTTRETLSKTLAEFRRRGWVATDDRSLRITDLRGLRGRIEPPPS